MRLNIIDGSFQFISNRNSILMLRLKLILYKSQQQLLLKLWLSIKKKSILVKSLLDREQSESCPFWIKEKLPTSKRDSFQFFVALPYLTVLSRFNLNLHSKELLNFNPLKNKNLSRDLFFIHKNILLVAYLKVKASDPKLKFNLKTNCWTWGLSFSMSLLKKHSL